ncbi:hypothetical protein B0T24DRAFT_191939 [Lasiosphaeria ovina]|uniref:Nudix hydrolase domain-containing protein n=1 Tax=Lasiosphaeria ovina TaxID=92902 RepID=A0AAE0NF58_9PEZI|nr:hypothetical protein B0T24DRAFT_191939 [Lasiosphaeria ovina]
MAESTMQLEDWLDDLCVRFIINLPKEDLSSVARICFQVEEAQWFYEDFIRPLDPTLPSMSLRSFCLRIFQHCPLLASFSVENHMRAFDQFLQYKTRVPVRGAILLNEAMDSTVLVKGWKKGANWSFPRGKINKDEDDLDCAIREVYEETGFDIKEAGLVPKDDEVKYIQISMREQQIRLYVFRDIPMDTPFHPRTRKEISKIQWYKLSELPAFRKKGSNHPDDLAAVTNANKFYMVAPFLVPLKKWVVQQRKKDEIRAASHSHLPVHIPIEEPLTEDDIGSHTEPLAGPSNCTPAIETLAGATLELQRLLKVQPPIQGLQRSPSTAANPDKGEALMAILQKKSELPSQQAQTSEQSQPNQSQLPHTPFDLTYSNAPEPHTPHHHHPTQRMRVDDYQAPPTFSVRPTSNQNLPGGYFNQMRAPIQAPLQHQFYGRNQYVNPNHMPRKEPILLHPQPLPPQVQQSLLTRAILPTPNIPDPAAHGPMQARHIPQNVFAASNPEPLQAQQQPSNIPPQLTNHKMSLLNAFKTENQESGENKASVVGSRDGAGPQLNSQTQHPSTHRANLPVSQQANAAAQYLPHNMAQAGKPRFDNNAPQTMASPAGPSASVPYPVQSTDSHRSTLLDMFKKPAPMSSPSGESITNRSKGKEPAVFEGMEGPGGPISKPFSAAEALAFVPDARGAPLRMNPEVNLPYRAVQILSRPKQSETDKRQNFVVKQVPSQPASGGTTRYETMSTGQSNLPSPRSRGVVYVSESRDKMPQTAGLAYKQSPLQTHSATHSAPEPQSHQPSGTVPRQPDAIPEQKHKLLSLFGKGQPSPTGFAGGEQAKMKEPAMFEQVRSGTPRSRVASLASASGDHGQGSAPVSRRSSQTPISPADRNFLLSYLESVSSVGR